MACGHFSAAGFVPRRQKAWFLPAAHQVPSPQCVAFIVANDYINGACIDIDGGPDLESGRRTQMGSCFS
jgi:hypothetical protein